MCDAHLRSLPKPEEQPRHNWHTTQYDNRGLNMDCQAGKKRDRRREGGGRGEADKLGRNLQGPTGVNF